MRYALLVLLVSACASPETEAPAPSDPAAPSEPSATPAPSEPPVSLAEILNRLDTEGDESSLVAELTEAGEVVVTTEENRHTRGQIDTVRTIRFPGLEVEAYAVSGGPTFVREVRVTGGDYASAEGLGAGVSRETVEGLYGEPVRTLGERVIYETSDAPAPTTLEVVYGPEGEAVRLVWRPYVD